MRRLFHIIILSAFVSLYSCQREDVPAADNTEDIPAVNGHYVPGKAVVRMSEGLVSAIESGQRSCEIIPGATVRRTFAHGGIYEERMRKAGLHLWYDVEFDESRPLTKTGESLLDVEGVDLVEYVPVVISTSDTYPFDDPDLKKQWHYYNKGNILTGLEKGCDINVFPAWERGVVGSSDVVVAVIDGGVDVGHDDLKDNLWSGTDTLGNTIHGYNFVSDTYTVTPDSHGTHVAGTIAAVNNNGIGVSGIAGGNAAEGIGGVRIMSCQIFEGEDGSGSGASAIVWAANNGAVIAQNSWSFPLEDNPDLTDTPQYIKTAVDYFNTYAGCDSEGNQLPDSHMKGGVVIFAAGNEAKSMGYPASYTGCVAVSSIAGDYELAYYSNFGDWVDIAAPGGDAMKNQQVYSTVPGNSYAYMQGTSMACPHVSGVAALIVSEFGGQGFTREDLIDRLLETAADISLTSVEMGAGMVDASAAVAHYGEDLPNVPVYAGYDDLSGTSLRLKYLMPEDNNGVVCRKVDFYRSLESFDEVSDHLTKITLSTSSAHAGDTLYFTIDKLTYNTTYYFSVKGYDLYDNSSVLSENVKITTRDNLAPVIVALDGTEHTLKKFMTSKFKFTVTDPENELNEVGYDNATDSDVLTKENDVYVLTIDAKAIPAGTYRSRIYASDAAGKSSECEIVFVVEENSAPEQVAQFENILFTARSKSRMIDLNEYISDPDGESLEYSVVSSSESVAKVSVSKGTLTVNSVAFGTAEITITATDALQKSLIATFKVVVRDGTKAVDVYPNPVKDGKLYLRTSQHEDVDVFISGSSGAVIYDSKAVADPFDPVAIDISGAVPGVYNVKVTTASGKVMTQNIVKL